MFIYNFVLVKELRHEGSVAVTYDVTAWFRCQSSFSGREYPAAGNVNTADREGGCFAKGFSDLCTPYLKWSKSSRIYRMSDRRAARAVLYNIVYKVLVNICKRTK